MARLYDFLVIDLSLSETSRQVGDTGDPQHLHAEMARRDHLVHRRHADQVASQRSKCAYLGRRFVVRASQSQVHTLRHRDPFRRSGLLRQGAGVVLDVEDALDAVLGLDRPVTTAAGGAGAELPADLGRVLDAVAAGDPVPAAAADGPGVAAALAALADLEGRGLVRRAPGGRWVATGPVS